MIILASESKVRAALLRRAGVDVDLMPARVDEPSIKQSLGAQGYPPRDVADALAEAKAAKLGARHVHRFVIGADQVMEHEGELLDKPSSVAAARDRLLRLRNNTHELHSAVVIFEGPRPVFRHIARARLTMRDFSDAFLDAYLEHEGDHAMQTVGGYRLEEWGSQLFSKIEGDYFAILGLPLLPTLDYLRTRHLIPT